MSDLSNQAAQNIVDALESELGRFDPSDYGGSSSASQTKSNTKDGMEIIARFIQASSGASFEAAYSSEPVPQSRSKFEWTSTELEDLDYMDLDSFGEIKFFNDARYRVHFSGTLTGALKGVVSTFTVDFDLNGTILDRSIRTESWDGGGDVSVSTEMIVPANENDVLTINAVGGNGEGGQLDVKNGVFNVVVL